MQLPGGVEPNSIQLLSSEQLCLGPASPLGVVPPDHRE